MQEDKTTHLVPLIAFDFQDDPEASNMASACCNQSRVTEEPTAGSSCAVRADSGWDKKKKKKTAKGNQKKPKLFFALFSPHNTRLQHKA